MSQIFYKNVVMILCETKFRPQYHPVSDMEFKCYLKAKRKKNMKKALY